MAIYQYVERIWRILVTPNFTYNIYNHGESIDEDGIDGNYPIFTMVMLIYHLVERFWRILVTPYFLYNIYGNEQIISRGTS